MDFRRVATATMVAGTLDIGSAVLLTLAHGKSVGAMLQTVASGPLGDAMQKAGAAGAGAGLLVHYALMAVMALVFALAADRLLALVRRPLAAGAAYGVLIYLVMYWVVIPLRWGAATMTFGPGRTLIPIAIHILLVGIPIALIIAGPRAGRDARPLRAVG